MRACAPSAVIASTKTTAPAMRMTGRTSSRVIPPRGAHCVQSVTTPASSRIASRSGSGAACGSSKVAARSGSANHADSPVSQNDTSTPAAAAVLATVNAWEQRSGASAPAVALTTSRRAMGVSIRPTRLRCPNHGYRDRIREPAGRRAGRARRRSGLSGDAFVKGALVTTSENPLGPPPWLNAPPVEPYPYEDTYDLRKGPDLHPALLGMLPFIGFWRGRGQGGYPGVEDFNFAQEITISHDGRPFLAYESRAWLLDDDSGPVRMASREVGWWRPVTDDQGRATDDMEA